MNELEAICNAISQLGGEAQTAFVVWCIVQLVKTVVTWGCIVGGVAIIARHAVKAVEVDSCSTQLLHNIARLVHPNRTFDITYQPDHADLFKAIARLIEENSCKENKKY